MGELPSWLWILVAAAGLAAWLGALGARRNRTRRGWWVEPLSAARLRGADDEVALVYHEGERSLWLGGTWAGPGARERIHLPGAKDWDALVEPWARGRRAEILARLSSDAYVRSRVEFVDGNG
jgi:hypothetical protein